MLASVKTKYPSNDNDQQYPTPRKVWSLSMGYDVDAQTLEVYSQHLLRKPVDSNEPRFGTFKEKDMELHEKFT